MKSRRKSGAKGVARRKVGNGKLSRQVAGAQRQAKAARSRAQTAKANLKRARKAFKKARKLAKVARKKLKALKGALMPAHYPAPKPAAGAARKSGSRKPAARKSAVKPKAKSPRKIRPSKATVTPTLESMPREAALWTEPVAPTETPASAPFDQDPGAAPSLSFPPPEPPVA